MKNRSKSLQAKRSLLLGLAFFFILHIAHGAEIDSITAADVARDFYVSRLSQSKLKQSLSTGFELKLKKSSYDSDSHRPLYYVFNVNDDDGFIIVSADDRVTPVLGYSYTGSFSMLNQPPAFKEWMQNYEEQIRYLIENDLEGAKNDPALKSTYIIDDVLPLLTTTWDQGCYYNALCPPDVSGPCDHTLVGCVAIAMGQIMNFWDHPVSSNSIPGYYAYPDLGCLQNIGPTQYNWASMPDELNVQSSSEQVQAVSELLYNVGVASLMSYGSDASATFSSAAKDAFISYFHYSASLQHLDRDDYNDTDWATMLRNELDSGRPVYYGGSGTGGHAFVCDGYEGLEYFHFNWGWGGAYDGFFHISDLSPGYNVFNNYQTAIVGISPGGVQSDPLENVLEIEACGSENPVNFSGTGAGTWDLQFCSSTTPGQEQVYSFIAPETGFYSIEVVSADSEVAYGWKQAYCGYPGWQCIGTINSVGEYGSMYWTADSTYYFYLDDVDLSSSTHQFYLNCPDPTYPSIEYHSHAVDDDSVAPSSGDNDGRAEPGETIELSATLRNVGGGNAHNVFAELTTSNSYISIITANNGFGDIAAASSKQSAGAYSFDISVDCPEGEITFNLDIDSDEGSWSDQFTLYVYIDGPSEPEIEYSSHLIDDSNLVSGDDDGLAESGESIKMPVVLRNIGAADAHNVTAVLSAVDPLISITASTNSFGTISAGSSVQSSGNFQFDISADCPDKNVAFSLAISSDEGSWTDQFIIHIYQAPNSISDEPFNSAIAFYPNPARNAMFLKSAMEIDTQFEIRIMDSRGTMVFVQDFPSFIKGEIIEIDLSAFIPGIYFIQLRHSDLSESRKIIIE